MAKVTIEAKCNSRVIEALARKGEKISKDQRVKFRGELLDGVLYERLALHIEKYDLDIFFVWSASAVGEISRRHYQGEVYSEITQHPLYGKRNEMGGCYLAIGTRKPMLVIGEDE